MISDIQQYERRLVPEIIIWGTPPILNRFTILNIYFYMKSIEDQQRILRDSGFGC